MVLVKMFRKGNTATVVVKIKTSEVYGNLDLYTFCQKSFKRIFSCHPPQTFVEFP